MSEEMQIEGKSYISSKRAAEISRYAQDYIGQLARKSLIDARRIGGLWYVSMESLEAYKSKAEEYKPVPPGKPTTPEPGTLIFFDGKEYLSAARAADQTGYTQDYVGQLARSGAILSRQVGNRWYVERQSIIDHKREKDALLANVQRDSVGLQKREVVQNSSPEALGNPSYFGHEPLLNYYSDDSDLIATTNKNEEEVKSEAFGVAMPVALAKPIPIHRLSPIRVAKRPIVQRAPQLALPPARSSVPLLAAAFATIVIVLSVGYTSVLKQNSVYAVGTIPANASLTALKANAYDAFSAIGTMLEPYLSHQLVYERPQQ